MSLSFTWKSFSHKYRKSRKTLLKCVTDHRELKTNKIAAFDLDSTLIKPKSGGVFPKNNDDWTLWHPSVKEKLIKLHDDNVKIVIFTNQASLKIVKNIQRFQTKVEHILEELGLAIDVFISMDHDIFRKPAPGMWKHLESELLENGIEIDKSQSFYVGDAAGRSEGWQPNKIQDFSAGDRLFAFNIGITFFTPEEYFLNQPQASSRITDFNPRTLSIVPEPNYNIPSPQCEGIVMVGASGSGKSFFVQTHLSPNNYTVISEDSLNSWSDCERSIKKCLTEKLSFVVDNANPDSEKRELIIKLCKGFDIHVRCFVMKTKPEHCFHNNRFREIIGRDVKVVQKEEIQRFWLTYEKPTEDEGFDAVVHVPFIPNFESDEYKELYQMYLLCSRIRHRRRI